MAPPFSAQTARSKHPIWAGTSTESPSFEQQEAAVRRCFTPNCFAQLKQ